MLACKPINLNASPPLSLRIVHFDALAADLAASGITGSAVALARHIRNRVSRPLPAGAEDGGAHGDNR